MTDTTQTPQTPQTPQHSNRDNKRGPRPNRPQMTWKVAETFKDPKSGVAVVVSKSLNINPTFSFQIGRVREDGSVSTNLQFRTQRNIATFELETNYATVIATLMAAAQEYAVMDMQYDWARQVDTQIERETRRMGQSDGGGGQKKNGILHPGKTARDKAKHTRPKA